MTDRREHTPIADYAGDADMKSAVDVDRLFVFTIETEPDPDVFARTANIFNLANIAPKKVHFERKSTGNIAMSVAISLRSGTLADMIRRKLEQLTCTLSVLVTCKPE